VPEVVGQHPRRHADHLADPPQVDAWVGGQEVVDSTTTLQFKSRSHLDHRNSAIYKDTRTARFIASQTVPTDSTDLVASSTISHAPWTRKIAKAAERRRNRRSR